MYVNMHTHIHTYIYIYVYIYNIYIYLIWFYYVLLDLLEEVEYISKNNGPSHIFHTEKENTHPFWALEARLEPWSVHPDLRQSWDGNGWENS